jgi:hypothetical protein
MELGPLELIVLTFPADRLAGGVAATLDRLAGAGDVRVVDAVLVRTDAAGGACAMELAELPGLRGTPATFEAIASGLITEADVDEIAAVVDAGTDAVAVLVEHRWAADIAGQATASDGIMVASARIPPEHAAQATQRR